MKISILFKAFRKLRGILQNIFFTPLAKMNFVLNGVQFKPGLHVNGLIKVIVTRRGQVDIGHGLRINSGNNFNIIGRQQKNIFWVEGTLTIGNSVGISTSAIICNHEITIGNNVVIGGNTVIYDTDFHSLDVKQRNKRNQDHINAKWAPVNIADNVFIGAHSTILKGVSIGENSIIGACSVVTKSIPPNETWAGNPAQCINKNNNETTPHWR